LAGGIWCPNVFVKDDSEGPGIESTGEEVSAPGRGSRVFWMVDIDDCGDDALEFERGRTR
jgi:hypothetical protein